MTASRMPRLADLGGDLTETTVARRYLAVAVPLLCVAGFFTSAFAGLWPLSVLCAMAYSFFSFGSTSHDLVHGNLGFGPRENAFWLSLIELLGLRSGHAYSAAHLHHHARFPHDDDVEAAAAHHSFWWALAAGPLQTPRVCLWALRNARRFRALIVFEMALCVVLLAGAMAACGWTYVPITYAVLVVAGSWIFPLVTAYLPHDPSGKTVLEQTLRFRGPVARVLFLDHMYHLEHHLYPCVPRHHWARLARRLDPWLDTQGVVARRLGRADGLIALPRCFRHRALDRTEQR